MNPIFLREGVKLTSFENHMDPRFRLSSPFYFSVSATLHLRSVVQNIFARPNGVGCCLDPGDVTEAPVSWGPAAHTLHPPAPRLPGLQAHATVLPAQGRGPGILTSRMSTISEN
jgi:hypothetical protein